MVYISGPNKQSRSLLNVGHSQARSAWPLVLAQPGGPGSEGTQLTWLVVPPNASKSIKKAKANASKSIKKQKGGGYGRLMPAALAKTGWTAKPQGA